MYVKRAPARCAGRLLLRQSRLVRRLPPPRPFQVRRAVYAQRRQRLQAMPASSSAEAAVATAVVGRTAQPAEEERTVTQQVVLQL